MLGSRFTVRPRFTAHVVSPMAYKVTFVSDKGVEKTVMCENDEYLLDAADANGVDLPASCRGTPFKAFKI